MSPEATATPRQIGLYDLLSKIAEGGMGAVYKAKSRVTGDVVAIKIIPAETARNPILVKRFEQEFKAASLLDHPNVVKAIEYCGIGPTPFLVMEYVDGESLGQRVERDGPVPESLAVHFINQVCDGLQKAHKQGLIHRDVKPDNILITADGTAKLTDMGLVKEVEGELNLTKTGRGLGTPHFMAPEQFRNAKNADVKCDIYSLGATLYMMVTGEVPFAKTSPLDCWMRKIKNDFPPPKKVNPQVSDRLDWAIRRAMMADPKERPASCKEFVEDLTGMAWRNRAAAAPGSGVGSGVGTGSGSVPEVPATAAAAPAADLWYLVYKGPNAESHTVKGTTESIRQNVRAGYLGDPAGVVVCRTKTGQFLPLRGVPEFRDLVVGPAATDPGGVGSGIVPKPKNRSGVRSGIRPAVGDPAAVARTPTPAHVTPRSAPPAGRKLPADPAADVPTDPHPIAPLASSSVSTARPAARADWPGWLPGAVAGAAVVVLAVVAFFLFR
jgi:serine/threonine protein kinase